MDTYYLKSLIFDLTILEYEVLCVALPNYNKHRLIKKAFKKTKNNIKNIKKYFKNFSLEAEISCEIDPPEQPVPSVARTGP